MTMMSDIFGKRVIDQNGKELGVIHDADVDLQEGKVNAFYMSKPAVFPGKTGAATGKIIGKISGSIKGTDPGQQNVEPNIRVGPTQIAGVKDVVVLSEGFTSSPTTSPSASTE